METEKLIQTLKKEFLLKFGHKYDITEEFPVGEGCYAVVFRGKDRDRPKIEVAIKIFFDGIAPQGAERGWFITSKVINNQIAPTYTIETFYSDELQTECKAVVQYFIPGKSLKSVWKWWDDLEKNRKLHLVIDDFADSFFLSLLQAISFCHSLGYGHGDFHDGNIMVVPIQSDSAFSFTAVLIDFENASIKATIGKTGGEQGKIESDMSLLKRLWRNCLNEWKYYNSVNTIFESYTKSNDVYIGYSLIIQLIKKLKNGSITKPDILSILKQLPHPFTGFSPSHTLTAMKGILKMEGFEELFVESLKEFNEAYSNAENWHFESEVIENPDEKIRLYGSFFGW